MTAFEAGRFYAATVYPLRNPYPGSHAVGELDLSSWRIDIVTMDGSAVVETKYDVPLGPHLRGFTPYPLAIVEPAVLPYLAFESCAERSKHVPTLPNVRTVGCSECSEHWWCTMLYIMYLVPGT